MSNRRGMAMILLALLTLFSACQHPPEWQNSIESWVGRDADELVRKWGVPTTSYTFKDGTKNLVYSYSRVDYTPSETYCYEDDGKTNCYTTGGYTSESNCKATFTVALNNIIVKGVYDGDYTGCQRFFNVHP